MTNTDPLKILKTVALFEGTSLIALLFIAMPFKYLMNMPIFVRVIGPIHGVLFLTFVGLLLGYFLKREINLPTLLLGIIASFIPFGTFIYKAKKLS